MRERHCAVAALDLWRRRRHSSAFFPFDLNQLVAALRRPAPGREIDTPMTRHQVITHVASVMRRWGEAFRPR